MPSQPIRSSITEMLQNRCAGMAARGEIASAAGQKRVRVGFSFSFNRFAGHMDNLSGYARRPFAFLLRYLRRRLASHVVILTAVVAAVVCSVGTQYGVKSLVDALAALPSRGGSVWLAFIFLMSLIAADNFLLRIASWTAS